MLLLCHMSGGTVPKGFRSCIHVEREQKKVPHINNECVLLYHMGITCWPVVKCWSVAMNACVRCRLIPTDQINMSSVLYRSTYQQQVSLQGKYRRLILVLRDGNPSVIDGFSSQRAKWLGNCILWRYHNVGQWVMNACVGPVGAASSLRRISGLINMITDPQLVDSPHKGPVICKVFSWHDVTWCSSVLVIECVCWHDLLPTADKLITVSYEATYNCKSHFK